MQTPITPSPIDSASRSAQVASKTSTISNGSSFDQMFSTQVKAQQSTNNIQSNSTQGNNNPVQNNPQSQQNSNNVNNSNNANNQNNAGNANNNTAAKVQSGQSAAPKATNAKSTTDKSDSPDKADDANQSTNQQPAVDPSALAAYVASLAQQAQQPQAAASTTTTVTTSSVSGAATTAELASLAQTAGKTTIATESNAPTTITGETKFVDLFASKTQLATASGKSESIPLTGLGVNADTALTPAQLSSLTQLNTSKLDIDTSTPGIAAPVSQQFSNVINAQAGDNNALAAKVGSPQWDQDVGQKVVWMVSGGKQTAELTLNPPDLGPLKIVISVNNDQATTNFVTAHPDVKSALEAALPKLQQMMGDAGMQLSGFSVSSQSANQSSQQFARQSGSGNSQTGAPEIDAIGATTTTITTKISTNLGLVDTFA